ncbi:hypothetical protein [Roseibium litorale]|uniref:Transmembrane protein PGPGW n=1 Tax=Roseibium litorale TaxID=2803841 RepID=A0ABR9CMM8_9HYPH|nr:hypothetical protein [Roseibium litorale]MBD8892118.1 hypothetical protein [Roseibium litorale]
MKLVWWALALVLILLGLATIALPIPTGVPLLATGAVILIATSRTLARALRSRRRRLPQLNRTFHWLETKSPRHLARILKRTRPRQPQSSS